MSFEPNEMMMELFRSEVESHSELLTSSVLALEQDPTATATLERMMRAAHSIKGAARIVRVPAAVDVAHAMEDCFVAAQKGSLTLTPDDFDVLLRGVDLLGRISAATKDQRADWAPIDASATAMVAELQRLPRCTPAATQPVTTTFARVADLPASTPAEQPRPVAAVATEIVCPPLLDAGAAERVRIQLLAALDAGSRDIQFNLSQTHDLDATGLAFLAAARLHVASRPLTTLRFHPVSSELQTVLHVTGLDAATNGTASQ